MIVKYKMKEYEIPGLITCDKDGGRMCYVKKEQAYRCLTVKGCKNKVSLKEYLQREKLFKGKGLEQDM